MNKLGKVKCYALLISSLTMLSNYVQADTFLGADIEVGFWSPSYNAGNIFENITGESKGYFASATIEHPLPLLPNLKVSLSSVDSSAYAYTKIDYTGYYEILDNKLVSFDVGLGVSQFYNGRYLKQSFAELLPHIYVDAEVSFPYSPITAYTDLHYFNIDGNSLTDAIIGLRYDVSLLATDIGIKAGYRTQKLDVADFDQLSFDIETKGFFVGLQADF